MIGQYLPNNNENSYSAILQKKIASKPALEKSSRIGELMAYEFGSHKRSNTFWIRTSYRAIQELF
jgi:hypothetical protein